MADLNAGQYQPLIDASASKYGINSPWLTRLLYQENRFKPTGTSPAGAQGIAQFMPGTATRYGVDVNNPASSIEGAAHYLSDNLKLFGGNVGLATAAYNWGEGNVQNWLKKGGGVPKETQDYVSTITGSPIATWAGAGGASSRLAVTPPASGPIDPSIIARGGVSPAIPETPGTTINTAATAPAASGVLPGFGSKEASDNFIKSAKQLDQGLGFGGGEQQGQERPPQMGPPPMARNVSQLLPMSGQYSQAIQQNAATPLTWQGAAPGQNPYGVAGQQTAPLAPPYGLSINSMSPLMYDPSMGYAGYV